MTGVGSPGGPGVIKMLAKQNDVYGCDLDSDACGRTMTKKFFQVPSAKDDKFIKEILRIGISEKINLIIPLVTQELQIFSDNVRVLKNAGINVLVENVKNLQILNNKYHLYEHLNSRKILLARYYIAKNEKELIKYIYDLGYPDKKVVVKPSKGNGSRGVRIIDNEVNFYDTWMSEKPDNMYINLETLNFMLKDGIRDELLVMEYLPGQEYTVDILFKSNGQSVPLIRTRDKMKNGITVAGTLVHNKHIHDMTLDIVSTFNDLQGPIGLQFKEDSLGRPRLLEANPRIQGTTVAWWGVGINVVQYYVDKVAGLPVQESNFLYPQKKFARIYDELFF